MNTEYRQSMDNFSIFRLLVITDSSCFIGTKPNLIYIIYHFSHNKVDPFSKLTLLITKHWVESLNATMHIDIHRTWGYRDPKTGIFNGMSGQLQSKEADVGGIY